MADAQQHPTKNPFSSPTKLTRSRAPGKPVSSPQPPPTEGHEELKKRLRAERADLVLWKHPLATLYHFVAQLLVIARHVLENLIEHWMKVGMIACSLGAAAFYVETSHGELATEIRSELYTAGFWIVLGILSSIGLGTGLHTFVLYLGPYIARVTLAAYHCDHTEFMPPFSSSNPTTWKDVTCVQGTPTVEMTIWLVLSKVRWPAMLWGLGTAIGELPPYFMARAARLSGVMPDDEDMEEFHEHLRAQEQEVSDKDEQGPGLAARLKRGVHHLVNKAGFLGILLCASIPNPLFDLAGITCGHFLVPFSTFFLAVALGKAVIKTHLQMMFVIIAMSESVLDPILQNLKLIPIAGSHIVVFVEKYRTSTKSTLDHEAGSPQDEPPTSVLAMLLGGLVVSMIVYFALSIVNHLAQRHKQSVDHHTLTHCAKRD